MLGEMLPSLQHFGLPVASCTLWAPACTLEMALDRYQPAFDSEAGVLGPSKERFAVEVLTDEREQADSSGPYGKSILYLVSRALEDFHKTPLLGMAREWDSDVDTEQWGEEGEPIVERWRRYAARKRIRPSKIVAQDTIEVILDERTSPSQHGAFDNDVHALQRALTRILGGDDAAISRRELARLLSLASTRGIGPQQFVVAPTLTSAPAAMRARSRSVGNARYVERDRPRPRAVLPWVRNYLGTSGVVRGSGWRPPAAQVHCRSDSPSGTRRRPSGAAGRTEA